MPNAQLLPAQSPIEPWALELAAQCWCAPSTQGIVMDVALCEEFARTLMQQRDAYMQARALDAGG